MSGSRDSGLALLNPPDAKKLLKAAYNAPGSLWRLHLDGERYAVDVRLIGVATEDHKAAAACLRAAGLECTWVIPIERAPAAPPPLWLRPLPTGADNSEMWELNTSVLDTISFQPTPDLPDFMPADRFMAEIIQLRPRASIYALPIASSELFERIKPSDLKKALQCLEGTLNYAA